MTVGLAIFFVTFAAIGLVLRRLVVVAAGVLFVPCVWLAAYVGLIGAGVGGEWQPFAIAQTIAASLGSIFGVVTGRLVWGPVPRRPGRNA